MSKAPHASAHAALLDAAMKSHAAGRLEEARSRYRKLLSAAPRHADALHLMGVLEAQLSRFEHAATLIGKALAIRPGEAMFHNNLGNVHAKTGRLGEAQTSYRRACELDPMRPDVLNNLGIMLSHGPRPEEGEALLQRARELAPDFLDARQNLASHFLRQGKTREALEVCVEAGLVAPHHPSLRRLLGAIYTSMGRNEDAQALYRTWLQEDPDNPEAQFRLVASTQRDVPERAPDPYLAEHFDRFASSFDSQLTSLAYRGPELVAQALSVRAPTPELQFDITDAGCGTGLCAPLLKPWARRLVGVDLSTGMLEKARHRGLYDELVSGELVAFLSRYPASCDVLVSADTLCYFGALESFAAAARAALRPGGWLLATVEAHADEPGSPAYRLQGHGRYSHRHAYVQGTLQSVGLAEIELQPVVLRVEAHKPVDAWLVSARVAPVA